MLAKRLLPALLVLAPVVHATETWFEPLTVERLATLAENEQSAWQRYLARSKQLLAVDKAYFDAELLAAELRASLPPPASNGFGVPLDSPVEWFASDEGRRVIGAIISFQTPAGGWSKHIHFGQGPRARGMRFSASENWSYVGTFDNGATTTQLRALARAVTATGDENAQQSFFRGLNYIFAAQNPHGGWPQVFPLAGGYHDAITYNDDAMINIVVLLRQIAAGASDFAFVPAEIRARASGAVERAVSCFLSSQITVDGKLTGWCQQHDAVTLKPCGARNFEPVALCSAETASILRFLLDQPNPTTEVLAAIRGAAAWLEATALNGYAWKTVGAEGRRLVPDANAGTLWARFYEIGTNRPIFGDRDRSIHYDVNEISAERRNGYSWYSNNPSRHLQHYRRWERRLAETPASN